VAVAVAAVAFWWTLRLGADGREASLGAGEEIVGHARDDGEAGSSSDGRDMGASDMGDGTADEDDRAPPTRLVPEVLAVHPHDPEAFTQGLLFHDGSLFESTGLRGRSDLRRVTPSTGEVTLRRTLDADLFAEGLARRGDELVQLTWEAGRALVWRLPELTQAREHSYRGEGWGLCWDGGRFVMSDGSDTLTFRRPSDFARVGIVQVRAQGRPVRRLNELECVDGVIWANVWMRNVIVRIDPESGRVTGEVDARRLDPGIRDRSGAVLNGIANVPGTDRFYVTGKLWDRMYEVRFVPGDD